MRAGDVVVFPPRSVHGIDVSEDARMYCLELMQPNDMFAGEPVRLAMSCHHTTMRERDVLDDVDNHSLVLPHPCFA